MFYALYYLHCCYGIQLNIQMSFFQKCISSFLLMRKYTALLNGYKNVQVAQNYFGELIYISE